MYLPVSTVRAVAKTELSVFASIATALTRLLLVSLCRVVLCVMRIGYPIHPPPLSIPTVLTFQPGKEYMLELVKTHCICPPSSLSICPRRTSRNPRRSTLVHRRSKRWAKQLGRGWDWGSSGSGLAMQLGLWSPVLERASARASVRPLWASARATTSDAGLVRSSALASVADGNQYPGHHCLR